MFLREVALLGQRARELGKARIVQADHASGCGVTSTDRLPENRTRQVVGNRHREVDFPGQKLLLHSTELDGKHHELHLRRGLAESIEGRLQRAGGTATITSTPGGGTEVELRLP